MENKGIVFSGVSKLEWENIACDILGNKYLNIKIMTLPIQDEELLQDIIEYIKSNEDFKITIEKLED
jgi:DUF1009 family protein